MPILKKLALQSNGRRISLAVPAKDRLLATRISNSFGLAFHVQVYGEFLATAVLDTQWRFRVFWRSSISRRFLIPKWSAELLGPFLGCKSGNQNESGHKK